MCLFLFQYFWSQVIADLTHSSQSSLFNILLFKYVYVNYCKWTVVNVSDIRNQIFCFYNTEGGRKVESQAQKLHSIDARTSSSCSWWKCQCPWASKSQVNKYAHDIDIQLISSYLAWSAQSLLSTYFFCLKTNDDRVNLLFNLWLADVAMFVATGFTYRRCRIRCRVAMKSLPMFISLFVTR